MKNLFSKAFLSFGVFQSLKAVSNVIVSLNVKMKSRSSFLFPFREEVYYLRRFYSTLKRILSRLPLATYFFDIFLQNETLTFFAL